MGKLAADMLRLCEEIIELRAARQTFVVDLRASVDELRARFRHEHSIMARASRAERHEFLSELAEARKAWSGLASAGSNRARAMDVEVQGKEAEGGGGRRETGSRKRKRSGLN